MVKKVNKFDISEILYIFGAELYIFLGIIRDANFSLGQRALFNKINKGLSLFLMMILLISLIIQLKKLTNKKFFFILIFMIVEILIKINDGLLLPISFFLLIIAYPSTLKIEDFARYTYFTMFASILLVFVGCWSNLIIDSVIYRNGLTRHSMGFVTPNSYGNKIIILLFIRLCYGWNKKWKWYSILIWFILIGYTYFYANSRASFYFGLLIMILVIGKKYQVISLVLNKIIYKVPILMYCFNAIITLSAMIYFSNTQNSIYYGINNLVSNRLDYITSFYNLYGLKLWGTKNIEFVSWNEASRSYGLLKWFGIDNSYAYIAIVNGLIVLILFGIMYYFAQRKAFEDRNLGIEIYLTLFAIMGLTENYMMNYALNFSIFIFAAYLASHKEIENIGATNGE
ncbi:hypothetical protein NR996_04950 [Lactobacillus rodentium]|uniref:Polysaccharide polymerase n=1 Tax=Lactobacillus rodentium TaxID=947835 RepID=A0A2Z6T6W0_9LACO|nr:hypothetical protein [Lactobacillus rodentium]MCR1894755.1 hypothetical protein [Lactobacillus rodentium]GBG04994.1 hypothetical protein LrDSM24759_09080 [Lactobacillus rodentium]